MQRAGLALVLLCSATAEALVIGARPYALWPQRAQAGIIACAEPAVSNDPTPPIDTMRLKAIQAELDERGVRWRGIYFEKERLAAVLAEARLAPQQRRRDVNL